MDAAALDYIYRPREHRTTRLLALSLLPSSVVIIKSVPFSVPFDIPFRVLPQPDDL